MKLQSVYNSQSVISIMTPIYRYEKMEVTHLPGCIAVKNHFKKQNDQALGLIKIN